MNPHQVSATTITSQNIAAAILIQTCFTMPMWLSPLLVGAVSDHLGFMPAETAWMASADVTGVLLASAMALLWIGRVSWRALAWPCALLIIVLNLASTQAGSFAALYTLRVGAGLLAGSMIAVCGAVLGASTQPERSVALFTGFQLATAGILFLFLPGWIRDYGTIAIYGLLAALACAGPLLIRWLPADARSASYDPLRRDSAPAVRGVSGYGGLLTLVLPGFLFHVGVSSTWAFMERNALEAGLEAGQAGQALAMAMATGVCGSLLAFLAGLRFGRLLPFTLVLLVQLFALGLILGGRAGFLEFLVALALLGFSFNLVVSYQFGMAAQWLRGPATPVAYLLSLQLGMVSGPLLAAHWISETDHGPALWLAGWFFIGSFMLSVGLLLRQNRHERRNRPQG